MKAEYRPPNLDMADKEVQVQDAKENTATVEVDGNDVEIKQKVYIGYEVVQDVETPNYMGFLFELDAPKSAIPERSIVLQYVTFRNVESYNSEWMTVVCMTQTSVRGKEMVQNFASWDGFFTGLDANDVAYMWDAQHPEMFKEQDPRDGTPFFRTRLNDEEAYKLRASDGTPGNQLQPCMAQVELPKQMEEDSDVFGDYQMRYGARIYAVPSKTDFIQVPEDKETVTLEEPEYDDEVYEEIEAKEKRQDRTFVFIEDDAIDAAELCGAGAEAYISFEGTLVMSPGEDVEQYVVFDMTAGVPNTCANAIDNKMITGAFSLTS